MASHDNGVQRHTDGVETNEQNRAATQEKENILEVRDATVVFSMEHGESKVLNSVDFNVKRGEIIGIVGESGSGKSMLASSILDAVVDPGQLTGRIKYNPETGPSIDVLDQSSSELNEFRWEEVAMVFQGALSSFNPTLDIKDHFQETLDAHGRDISENMEYAKELLRDLHLDPDRVFQSYAHELSGGMKQRVSIALSLLLDPEVLVMDEPTAALDLLMQRSIISLINDIREDHNLTIIFITHDIELVSSLADRLSVMYAFEIIETGPAEKIVSDSRHPYTRALMNSTPTLETPVETMESISGESPSPVDIPSGCPYHPRCPLSDERCTIEDPKDYKVDETHTAACHYWEQVDNEITLK